MIRLVAFDLAWRAELATRLGLGRNHVSPVGASSRDLSMFEVAGRSFYIGATVPPGVDAVHVP